MNRRYIPDNVCPECGKVYEEEVEECEFCEWYDEIMSVPKEKTPGPFR